MDLPRAVDHIPIDGETTSNALPFGFNGHSLARGGEDRLEIQGDAAAKGQGFQGGQKLLKAGLLGEGEAQIQGDPTAQGQVLRGDPKVREPEASGEGIDGEGLGVRLYTTICDGEILLARTDPQLHPEVHSTQAEAGFHHHSACGPAREHVRRNIGPKVGGIGCDLPARNREVDFAQGVEESRRQRAKKERPLGPHGPKSASRRERLPNPAIGPQELRFPA